MYQKNINPNQSHNVYVRPFLTLILTWIFTVLAWAQPGPSPYRLVVTPAAIATNKHFLSNCSIKKNESEDWVVDCDYGIVPHKPSETNVFDHARFTLELNWIRQSGFGRVERDEKGTPARLLSNSEGGSTILPRGTGHVAGTLRPAIMFAYRSPSFVTTSVLIDLVQTDPERVVTQPKYEKTESKQTILASMEIPLAVNWPDHETWSRNDKVKTQPASEILREAKQAIDNLRSDGAQERLQNARKLLERLLVKDPKSAQAYVELARIAMKSNWGAEGLRQADSLLRSALQVQPLYPNALILQGYVFTQQGRFGEAESAFKAVSNAEVKNPWLWSNWGELLAKQGKTEGAIAKYRKAAEYKLTGDGYDQAIIEAYEQLLTLLSDRKDFDGMEILHAQRAKDFYPESCAGARYAHFKLMQRNDYVSAIAIAEDAAKTGCKSANQVLGLAYYTAWALSRDSDRNDQLNRARIYFPAGANLIYGLAGSDYTSVAIKQLKAIGESVDQPDNEGMTALAHALNNRAYESVVRLIRLGAKPDALIGPQAFPVAFIPIFSKDYEGVRTLKKSGVDYSKLRFQGATASDLSNKIGDPKLIELFKVAGSKT